MGCLMKTILVIDDSRFSYEEIKEFVPQDKFTVAGYATNGEQGVRMYEELNPDIVTLDIIMPGLDGLEAAAEIISIDKGAAKKIIMLSALYDKDTLDEINGLGIKHFVMKPIKFNDLMEAINDIIEN